MNGYTMSVECVADIFDEIEPLARAHYAEMSDRLERDGFQTSPYNPRLNEYFKASRDGWLLTFLLRYDGKAVGYANVYVTNDMHNGDLIAQEDTLFVLKEHRNGIGRKFVRFCLDKLKDRGARRLSVSALTDLRVAKLWKRMGFKEVAVQMMYTF